MSKEPEIFTTANGQNYTVTCFDGKKGKRLLLRLVDLIKPSPDMNAAAVGKALMSGSNDNFVDKADKIITELLEAVYHKNGEETAQITDAYGAVHFTANYGTMLELLIKVIEFNGFLDLLEFLPTNMLEALVNMTSPKM